MLTCYLYNLISVFQLANILFYFNKHENVLNVIVNYSDFGMY